MANFSTPTILFIHGGSHNPNHFRPIRDLFESQGYLTECPFQPTSNPNLTRPMVSFEDDVKVTLAMLKKLVEEEKKDVVVVMHSYGGVIGTQTVHESFGKTWRQQKGLPGGVIGLIYMTAIIVPLGGSLGSAFGGEFPSTVKVDANGLATMDRPEHHFYNDLPKEEQDHWISELAPWSAIAGTAAVSYTAYQYYPVAYLYCTNDQVLSLEFQQMMVTEAGAEVMAEFCNSGHSPYLSQPETVLNTVKKMLYYFKH